MLKSSRNVFANILKLNFLEIQLEISIYKKHIPKSRVSYYLKSGKFHEPGSRNDTQTPCWLRLVQTATRLVQTQMKNSDAHESALGHVDPMSRRNCYLHFQISPYSLSIK